jgi:putative transposase
VCPKFRWPVLAGQVTARREELARAQGSGRGWRIVALEIVPDDVYPFVKAHPSCSPSRIAYRFRGLISRKLRAGVPHLQSRLTTLQSWLFVVTTAGAPFVETVRRYVDTQDERPWRKERSR